MENFNQEIKTLSKLPDSFSQREKIKELSKKTIIEPSNSNTVENHYKDLMQVNEFFFDKLQEKFPILNIIEQVICYYIHVGFKNKEIAEHLNASLRSVESRRYRIGKNIVEKTLEKIRLKEALNNIVLN